MRGNVTGDVATISFIECLVKGEAWQEENPVGILYQQAVWRTYRVWAEGLAEVWIVRQDGLRRAWSFNLGSYIEIGQSVIQFMPRDVKDEIAVDEDAQAGKPSRPRVV
jgi:hypothetical protein